MANDLRAVVVGGGHVGYHAAKHLHDRGHDVVIVEKDPDRVEFLSEQYIATVLEQAGLGRSDVVAALTDYGSMTNVGICKMAEHVEPGIRTVARIDHGDTDEYEEMIDEVVYPEQLAAHAATNAIMTATGSGVRTIEEVANDLELIEVTVSGDAPVAGKRLDEVSLPRGAVVVADKSGNRLPGPDTVLDAGNRYVLALHTDVSDEVVRLLRG
jgi:trk system potassium uptake protein TrkA